MHSFKHLVHSFPSLNDPQRITCLQNGELPPKEEGNCENQAYFMNHWKVPSKIHVYPESAELTLLKQGAWQVQSRAEECTAFRVSQNS